MRKRPHRPFCALCHREMAIQYWVPDDVWAAVVHPAYVNSIHCIDCFTRRADAQLIPWDDHIELMPVSMATQMPTTLNEHNHVEVETTQ